MGTFAQNNYTACGEQTGVWSYDTVFVNCDIVIPDGMELHIEAGTKVIFQGHFSMHVQGSLRAIGAESDSIFFTVADTVGFGDIHSNLGGWNGLRFEDTPLENDSSVFDYCCLTYGKAVGDSVNCYGGAIRLLRFSKVAITNSRLSHNYSFYWGGAVYASKAHISVKNCLFTDNYSGNDGMIYGYGGGLSFVSSNPILHEIEFCRNTSTGIGGGVSFEYSNPEIVNCVFDDNYSALGGAVGFLRSEPNRTIANLLVINNESKFFGGGIACVAASPQMTNLTIVNNFSAMGGGFYCNETSNTKLYNSILYGNQTYDTLGSQVWIWDVYSEPGFFNCDIQYGSDTFGGSTFHGLYENCIEGDPLFADPAAGSFKLTQESPCINSGTADTTGLLLPDYDLNLNLRILYGRIDIGAYEYDGPVGIAGSAQHEINAVVSPNPINSSSVVRIELPQSGKLSICLFDATGRSVIKKDMGVVAGHNIEFRLAEILPAGTLLAEGVYILQLNIEKHSKTVRIVVTK
jgi:predicted outer membrane repeat protein